MRPILDSSPRELLLDYARSNVLVGLDFDGTLAPIVEDPAAAAMRPPTRRLLDRVARRFPTAVVSGRAQSDVARRVAGIPLAAVIGNHGLEPSGSPGLYQRLVRRWLPRIEQVAASHPGMELEDKTYSVALHYRRCRAKKLALARLMELAEELGPLRVIHGKQVVNLLPLGAPDKGIALQQLGRSLGCDTLIYAGDDETDEDVFLSEVSGRLLGIRVERGRRSAAPFFVRDQAEVDELLRVLAEARGGRP